MYDDEGHDRETGHRITKWVFSRRVIIYIFVMYPSRKILCFFFVHPTYLYLHFIVSTRLKLVYFVN